MPYQGHIVLIITFISTHSASTALAAGDRIHRLVVLERHRLFQQLAFVAVEDVLYDVA